MLKITKRTLCVLMTLVLVFSTFGLTANAFVIPNDEEYKYFDVGNSFTAQADNDIYKVYKFTATADGLHRLHASFENKELIGDSFIAVSVYKAVGQAFNESEYQNGRDVKKTDTPVDLVFNAKSGESYYIQTFASYDSAIKKWDCKPYTVNCTIENLGIVTGASLNKAPDKLVYFDVDSSNPESKLYPADYTGIEIELALENGGKYVLTEDDNNYFELLDNDTFYCTLENGKNVMSLVVFDCEPMVYELECIPYFTDIRMTKNPDKLQYLYGLEGDWEYGFFVPAYNLSGAIIEATRYDGVSKTYVLNDSIEYNTEIDLEAYEIEPGLYLVLTYDGQPDEPERIYDIIITTSDWLSPSGPSSGIAMPPFECVKPTAQQVFMNLAGYIASYFELLWQKMFLLVF